VTTAPPAEPDRVAAALRGFGPAGIIVVLAVLLAGPLIGSVLVLLWAWRSRTPAKDLGFVRPKSWALTIAVGIIAGVALKLLMKAVVMPLLGAPPANPFYQHLVHNPGALPGMLFTVIVGAGYGEELIWRGFLFERIGRLIGTSPRARAAAAIVSATLFGLVHYPSQRWMGVQQAFLVGLIVGGTYAATRRIWPLIVLHAAFDVFAVLLIYFDLETAVARSIFR
jgi:CAAX protease family protein